MIYHSGQAAAPRSGLADKIINKSCWKSDRSVWWMIRATNTIKHLDVRPRLFEEREEGERALKKIQTPTGSRQTLMLNLCILLENVIQRYNPMCDFMHVSVHSRAIYLSVFDAVSVLYSTEAQCESISVIWGRSGSRQGSCCTGCCSSPPWCNGRYLLLTHSPRTITELCGGNLCLYYASPLPPLSSLSLLYL